MLKNNIVEDNEKSRVSTIIRAERGNKMSSYKNIIDALIVIDTETILEKYGISLDPDNPVPVPNDPVLIYLVMKRANSITGQAGNELTMSTEATKPMDTVSFIRWSITSLFLNSDSVVIPYKFIITPFSQKVISNPELHLVNVSDPLPNPNEPYNPTQQPIKKYFYSSRVLKPGKVTFNLCFLVVDRHGIKKGYFLWNPILTF